MPLVHRFVRQDFPGPCESNSSLSTSFDLFSVSTESRRSCALRNSSSRATNGQSYCTRTIALTLTTLGKVYSRAH